MDRNLRLLAAAADVKRYGCPLFGDFAAQLKSLRTTLGLNSWQEATEAPAT